MSLRRKMMLKAGAFPAVSAETEVAAWVVNVVANGGTVSDARLAAVRRFIEREKTIGAYALIDEYWFLWGESEAQAQVSFKRGLVLTPVATPTFAANQGYTGNGTSSYLRTGFIPSTMASALTGGAGRIEVYLRINAGATAVAMGAQGNTSMQIRPRTATDTITGSAMSAVVASATASTDSRGLSGVERNGTSAVSFDKNGVALASATAGSLSTSRTNREFFLLANNNDGTAATFDSRQIGYAAVGAPLLTDAMKATHYMHVQQLAVAVGANV